MANPTRKINWLAHHLPDPQDQREYVRERCVVAVTEALTAAMADAGLSPLTVAERIGRPVAFVERRLAGQCTMTLQTLGDILWACGLEMRDFGRTLTPLGEIEVAAGDAVEMF